jgi:nicotinamidase-related amidase
MEYEPRYVDAGAGDKTRDRTSHIDPRSAALLVMDYQVDTLTKFMTAAQSADAIACVPDLIAMARDAGMMVLHVVVAFRPSHPEVSPRNPLFSYWRWKSRGQPGRPRVSRELRDLIQRMSIFPPRAAAAGWIAANVSGTS